MAETQEQQRPLDEVMLAMDVVDTLRHRHLLVERELNVEERDRRLIDQLREIYASQGIAVPDHVLQEGLAALKEERFAYQPPPDGLSVRLARVYISRDKWLKPLLTLLGLAGALVLAYVLLVRAPHQRYVASLPGQIAAERAAIEHIARVPEATEQAQRLAAEGTDALGKNEPEDAQKKLAGLKRLRADLEREYELRIVSRPHERSAVIRTPDENRSANNYYIIVEAITPDGKALTLPVINEEDGQPASVSKWGLRVEKDVYDQIAADKRDDGIIQNHVFGVKRRGYFTPTYRMPTTGAALTTW